MERERDMMVRKINWAMQYADIRILTKIYRILAVAMLETWKEE